MNNPIILHVGQHKTGSTSIQNTLFTQRAALARHGVHYFDGERNHSILVAIVREAPRPDDLMHRQGFASAQSQRALGARLGRRLAKFLAEAPEGPRIISGEGLCDLDPDEASRFRDFLAGFSDDIRVIAYVREPFGYANSRAQQSLKRGATFAEIREASLADDSAGRRFSVHPNYRGRLEKYLELYGAERVTIRAFEPKGFPGGDVSEDFVQITLGRGCAELGIEPMRVNESLDQAAAEFVEARNRFVRRKGPKRGPVKNPAGFLAALMRMERRGSFRLPDFDYARFAEIVRPDVEWLETVTGGRIRFSLDPARWPDGPEPVDAGPLAATVERRLAEIDEVRADAMLLRNAIGLGMGVDGAAARFDAALAGTRDLRTLRQVATFLHGAGAENQARAALHRALEVSAGDAETQARLRRLGERLKLIEPAGANAGAG